MDNKEIAASLVNTVVNSPHFYFGPDASLPNAQKVDMLCQTVVELYNKIYNQLNLDE